MHKPLLAASLIALGACADASTSPVALSPTGIGPSPALAPGDNTVIVGESDVARQAEDTPPTRPWVLYTRTAGSTGDFVTGPGTPPLGSGSLHLQTPAGTDKAFLFNFDHVGTPLATITGITYATYKAIGVSVVAFPSINIQIDINGGTLGAGEFRTLVWEPYQQPGFADATGVWELRDAIAGGSGRWWSTTGGVPGGDSGCGQATPCSWSTILSVFPGATIVGGFGINQGSGNAGLDANVDALSIAYGGNRVTYDFENFTSCTFTTSGTTMTLQGDCQTSKTIAVPDGFTLDGDGHTITGIDPAGGHFTGAVIANGGASANVRNVTVTVSGLANVCDGGDARLRGILLEGASGEVTNNQVIDLRQGPSGCQEGNGIEVRNEPFEAGGSDVEVLITGNVITNYQKTGIVANGSVAATILGNTITGAGPVDYIAQNGIQVGFGATAIVRDNTVSGNSYTGEDVACGLLMYEADGVKASKNALFANERDNCNFGKGGGNYNLSM